MSDEIEQRDGRKEKVMHCGLSVSERDLLQSRLKDLPDIPPPRTVWDRIEAQARAQGLLVSRVPAGVKWLAGAGLAAAVVLAVLNIQVTPVVDEPAGEFSTVPPVSVATGNEVPADLSALMVQSRQIERDLRALPGQPSLVRAGTAATIADLEDRIATIDYHLNEPGLNLSRDEKEIYWRERVRLMNLLLDLRTAQAQRASF